MFYCHHHFFDVNAKQLYFGLLYLHSFDGARGCTARTFAVVGKLLLGCLTWVGFGFVGIFQCFLLPLSQLGTLLCFFSGLVFSWHV